MDVCVRKQSICRIRVIGLSVLLSVKIVQQHSVHYIQLDEESLTLTNMGYNIVCMIFPWSTTNI